MDHFSMWSGPTYAERSHSHRPRLAFRPRPISFVTVKSQAANDGQFSVGSGTTYAERSCVAVVSATIKDDDGRSEERTNSTVFLDDNSTPKSQFKLGAQKVANGGRGDQELFANLPSPDELGRGRKSRLVDDDDGVSQLTDADFLSVDTDMINERKRAKERQNQEGSAIQVSLVTQTPWKESTDGDDDDDDDDDDDEEYSA